MKRVLLLVGLSIGFIGCSVNSEPKVLPQVKEVKQVKKEKKKKTIKTKIKKEKKKRVTKKKLLNEPLKPAVMKVRFQSVDTKKAILVQKGDAKERCIRCGMNLVLFYKTNHMAIGPNEKKYQYCSLHCLADHLRDGAELRNPEVVDVSSLKFIPVLDAYYVVGSDVTGTMSKVSKYAFFSIDDAKKFQAEHGGVIMDFYGALEEAKKDFKK